MEGAAGVAEGGGVMDAAPIWIDECWIIERQCSGNWVPHSIGSYVNESEAIESMTPLVAEWRMNCRVRKYKALQRTAA